jgi:prepilin-type N-terminal cleavage/methylation domain-containing protein
MEKFLKKQKGFTLVELLIVIAIIAILVVIVIIAINPIERLNDARDRTAASNVRATGTLIATCVTQALTAVGGSVADCDTEGEIEAVADGAVAAGVTILPDAVPATTDVCAWAQGRTGRWFLFENDGTGGGTTTQFAAQPVAADCLN